MKQVKLKGNMMGNQNASVLISAVKYNEKLKFIDLSNNNLDDNISTVIKDMLSFN